VAGSWQVAPLQHAQAERSPLPRAPCCPAHVAPLSHVLGAPRTHRRLRLLAVTWRAAGPGRAVPGSWAGASERGVGAVERPANWVASARSRATARSRSVPSPPAGAARGRRGLLLATQSIRRFGSQAPHSRAAWLSARSARDSGSAARLGLAPGGGLPGAPLVSVRVRRGVPAWCGRPLPAGGPIRCSGRRDHLSRKGVSFAGTARRAACALDAGRAVAGERRGRQARASVTGISAECACCGRSPAARPVALARGRVR